MPLESKENYDVDSDVYYVTFSTNEPSGCHEIDDNIILEVGLFSGMVTGFRILNYSKIKSDPISWVSILDVAISETKAIHKDAATRIAAERAKFLLSSLESFLKKSQN